MERRIKAMIYGDSIMKGTVIDCAYRYHAMMNELLERFREKFSIDAENRARFGITIERGYGIISKDIEQGLDCEYALIEFGGNDCNYKWNEISVLPDAEHVPLTALQTFKDVYRRIIAELRAHGVEPILMTLPPIDAEKYLAFLSRNGNDARRILNWLGDVQMIYRFHESYSNAIARIAVETRTKLVDVRSYFLDKHDYKELVSIDGLHPTQKGYALVAKAFEDFIMLGRSAYPV